MSRDSTGATVTAGGGGAVGAFAVALPLEQADRIPPRRRRRIGSLGFMAGSGLRSRWS
jgi:hypothetical protein